MIVPSVGHRLQALVGDGQVQDDDFIAAPEAVFGQVLSIRSRNVISVVLSVAVSVGQPAVAGARPSERTGAPSASRAASSATIRRQVSALAGSIRPSAVIMAALIALNSA